MAILVHADKISVDNENHFLQILDVNSSVENITLYINESHENGTFLPQFPFW